MRPFLVSCALLLCAAISSPALADTFDFTISGGGFSGSGQIVTVAGGSPGVFMGTSASGTINGATVNPGLSNFGAPDNKVYDPPLADGSFLDSLGITFGLTNGKNLNITDTGTGYEFIYGVPGDFAFSSGTYSSVTVTPAATATPEPGSLSLLALGCIGVCGEMKRRYFSARS